VRGGIVSFIAMAYIIVLNPIILAGPEDVAGNQLQFTQVSAVTALTAGVMTILFGVLGYIFIKLKCEPAPLILAFVLGPLMEENLRRALLISRGDPMVFITRPISAAFLVATALLLAFMIVPSFRKKREEAVADSEAL
jgi:TctA family transporter